MRRRLSVNNGGLGFARNIERLLKEKHENRRCVVKWVVRTKQGGSYLGPSAWVAKHVFMPHNWKHKVPSRLILHRLGWWRGLRDCARHVAECIFRRVRKPP
jgi:hypothetical protein